MPIAEADLAILKEMHVRHQGTLSEEQRAANKAAYAATMGDEEKRAAFMKQMADTFTAADTNADGVLDLAEFKDFMQKLQANGEAAGYHVPQPNDADMEARFGVFDRYNAETTGVSLPDFMQCWKEAGQAMKDN